MILKIGKEYKWKEYIVEYCRHCESLIIVCRKCKSKSCFGISCPKCKCNCDFEEFNKERKPFDVEFELKHKNEGFIKSPNYER